MFWLVLHCLHLLLCVLLSSMSRTNNPNFDCLNFLEQAEASSPCLKCERIHFSDVSFTDFVWKLIKVNLDCLNFFRTGTSKKPMLKKWQTFTSQMWVLLTLTESWISVHNCKRKQKKQPWYGWTNTVRTKPTNKNKINNKQTVRTCNTANWFVCFVLLSITSLYFAGNAGRLTWVRHGSRKSSATHCYQCV